ncbi:MAG TPA: polysaccharide deacetylase family protein [Gammaproteobacteria bacterium]|nr:polysaccharide deacetylase family protein [Gammaproteobacteria bacterium]
MFPPSVLRLLGSLLSPAGRRGKLSILIYHRVLARHDPLLPSEIDAHTFRWQMELLAEYFHILPLSEAVDRLQTQSLPARAACITFDDGYADNQEVAMPILKEYGLTATFFVATGFLNGGIMWNDKIIEAVRHCQEPSLDLSELGMRCYDISSGRMKVSVIRALLEDLKYLPLSQRLEKVESITGLLNTPLQKDIMMSDDQVIDLARNGMSIGAHTVNHPILQKIDHTAMCSEIAQSRDYLQSLTGDNIDLFAYPNGKPGQDYGWEHVRCLQDMGFRAAVSTAWGVSTVSSDVYQLPRFTPWDRQPDRFLFRLLRNCLRKNAEKVGG